MKALGIIEHTLWHFNTEEEILTRVSHQQTTQVRRYRESHHSDTSDVIFICNQSMKQSFLKYGEVISLGVT